MFQRSKHICILHEVLLPLFGVRSCFACYNRYVWWPNLFIRDTYGASLDFFIHICKFSGKMQSVWFQAHSGYVINWIFDYKNIILLLIHISNTVKTNVLIKHKTCTIKDLQAFDYTWLYLAYSILFLLSHIDISFNLFYTSVCL